MHEELLLLRERHHKLLVEKSNEACRLHQIITKGTHMNDVGVVDFEAWVGAQSLRRDELLQLRVHLPNGEVNGEGGAKGERGDDGELRLREVLELEAVGEVLGELRVVGRDVGALGEDRAHREPQVVLRDRVGVVVVDPHRPPVWRETEGVGEHFAGVLVGPLASLR